MAEMPFLDSFGHYIGNTGPQITLAKWSSCPGLGESAGSPGEPTGSGIMVLGGPLSKTFTYLYNPIVVGFRYRAHFLNTSLITIGNNAPGHYQWTLQLEIDPFGQYFIDYVFGSIGSQHLVSLPGPSIATDTLYYLELEFTGALVANGNNGSVNCFNVQVNWVVRHNGIQIWTGSLISTQPLNSGFIDQSGSALPASAAQFNILTITPGSWINIGDLYATGTGGVPATTAELFGDVQIAPRFDRLDGTRLAWTPLVAGPHSDMIKEHIPDFDTTYISDSTPGDIDEAYMDPVLPFAGDIKGVQHLICAKNDEGAGIQIQGTQFRAGTTTLDDLMFEPSAASYSYYRDSRRVDPITGLDYTAANVDATQFGVKHL